MKIKYLLAASVVSLSAAATFTAPVHAQSITSGIEGRVTDNQGMVVPGATVVVVDTRTNQERSVAIDANGGFRLGSLPPGGPYTVTVTAPGFEGQTIEGVSLSVSGNTALRFSLDPSTTGETIVVTGARVRASQVAVGPGSAFGQRELEVFPSITRDIRDIIRIDPRVAISQGEDDEAEQISCLGANSRANTFTVDGIVQGDVFGLNGLPFASRSVTPIPFDVIEEISVEFAPFDVEYSEFTGCLINAVTKGGGNDFSGSAFFTYFDEGLQADEVVQADGVSRPFNAGRELRWGATLEGPIIPDRMFFSFGYEEAELENGFNRTPFGFGSGDEAANVSVEDFNRFAQIANDVYGQDIGGVGVSAPITNRRFFGRVDAILSDNHRLEGTYQRLEENSISPDFFRSFGGLNTFQVQGTESDTYSLRLYSQWNDAISTDIRVSRAEVADLQNPLGFGEAQAANPDTVLVVGIDNSANPDIGSNGRLVTGPGFSRSANELSTRIDQARFVLNYEAGAGHTFKIGTEVNSLDVFNVFVQNATGSLYFSSLDNFEAGILNNGTSTNTLFGSGLVNGTTIGADQQVAQDFDISNSAAEFSRQIYSFFLQDDWQATDQLAITAGVRVQFYDGDAPQPNPLFLERFGATNSVPFSSIDPLILPRLSATYNFDNDGFFSDSRITGGVGVFSGADPVVFFSNAFSNDGFTFGRADTRDCGPANFDANGQIVVSGPNVPQCVLDAGEARAAQGAGIVNATSPDLDIPTAVRANIGFQTYIGPDTGFFSDWLLKTDYIYTRFNDTLAVTDLLQAVDPREGLNGFTVDGRPIYRQIDPLLDGCNAQLQDISATPPVYTGLTSACFDGAQLEEGHVLTNGPSFDSHNFSLSLNKQFSEGIFTENGSVFVSFGYAFSDSRQTLDFRDSTASSNFEHTARFDQQNIAVSQAGDEVRHNFVMTLNFREEFIQDYNTNIGIFFRATEGNPFSLTYEPAGDGFSADSSNENNVLAYIPTGVSDPNLSPLSDPDAVNLFLDAINGANDAATGVLQDLNCKFTPGQTIERNSCRNEWYYDMDVRVSQELPFLGSLTGVKQDRVELYVDFANFLNLLDSDWNARRAYPGDFDNNVVSLVEAGVDDQGRYIITDFDDGAGEPDTFEQATAWRIQFGVRYEF